MTTPRRRPRWGCGGTTGASARSVLRCLSGVTLTLAVIGMPVAAQKPPKPSEKQLLERVASYVGGYVSQLINLVTEETFEQKRQGDPIRTRRLTSDILLVNKPGGVNEWLFFRDVT